MKELVNFTSSFFCVSNIGMGENVVYLNKNYIGAIIIYEKRVAVKVNTAN